MRLPRFRFTIRRLMIVVAVIALICCVVVLGRKRRERFAKRADDLRWASYVELHSDRRQRVADYYDELASKYEWAARHPLLPVAPDPPEPK